MGDDRRPARRCSPFLAILERITDGDDLISTYSVAATLVATTPIMLAGLGGLWSERAGVVNIGLEGMMILGTFGAGYFGYHYGAWAGVLGAIAMGMLGGLLHAIATVTFGVDHIISGVVDRIRATPLPGEVTIGGEAALSADFLDAVYGKLPARSSRSSPSSRSCSSRAPSARSSCRSRPSC